MDNREFSKIRCYLGKTQNQLSQLLGASTKATQSFEQGWREIPVHIERQILYLLAKCLHITSQSTLCWDMMECPDETRLACPAWEFQCGHICWFINGTICKGVVQHSWREKTKLCRQCDMLKNLLAELEQDSDTETQL